MKEFTAPAGIEVGLVRRRPALGPGIRVDERAVRRLGAMGRVAATPVPPRSRRIQYWMWNGMVREADTARVDPRLCYDFTFMADLPIGWERPKTLGHTHPRPAPGKLGFAEIVEVLDGTVGFMIQDLFPGPRSSFAALIVGKPGDRVVLPPFLLHASINLAGDPAVFSDVIDRRIVAGQLPSDYNGVADAHGMAYFMDVDGAARPNPVYKDVPPLQRFTALEWSGPAPDRPLYGDYVQRPDDFDWIVDPGLFPVRFPTLWARVSDVATRQGDSSGGRPVGDTRR
jgi:oxalate decarboxylase/phosphoglucose isomerase-like protein (cupin superfamily)